MLEYAIEISKEAKTTTGRAIRVPDPMRDYFLAIDESVRTQRETRHRIQETGKENYHPPNQMQEVEGMYRSVTCYTHNHLPNPIQRVDGVKALYIIGSLSP